MRSRVATLTVTDTAGRLAALLSARDDVADAGGVDELVTVEGDEPDVRWCWPTRREPGPVEAQAR